MTPKAQAEIIKKHQRRIRKAARKRFRRAMDLIERERAAYEIQRRKWYRDDDQE